MNSSFYMHTQKIKQKAIELRKAGYSYNYIMKHVPVAKSTLSEWLYDIPFTPNKYTQETIGNARLASGVYKNNIKKESMKNASEDAFKRIMSLSERDICMLGLGLYIGEGGKTGGITRIINSDPRIITMVLRWLQIEFGVKVENLKVRLHVYPDTDIVQAVKYWSKMLSIDKKYFSKPIIDLRTNKKTSYVGKLPHGTAHVTVKSLGDKKLGVYMHRSIMALIDRVFML